MAGSRRLSRGSIAPPRHRGPGPNRSSERRCTPRAGCSSSLPADARRRWPSSGPVSGWPARTSRPAPWRRTSGHSSCRRWSGRAGQTARKHCWPGCASANRPRPRCASHWRCCGSAGHDPQAAVVALAPVIDGSVGGIHPIWTVTAMLLEAITRDSLGDADAAGLALERALDIAEPDRWLLPFLLHPAPRPAGTPRLSDRARGPDRRHPRTDGGECAERRERREPRERRADRERRGCARPARRPAYESRSARQKPGSCATSPAACPCRRSPGSCICR